MTDWPDAEPVEGDFLLSHPGGSGYQILEIRPRSRGGFRARCRRLGREAVEPGQPGVFLFYWNSRRRRTSA